MNVNLETPEQARMRERKEFILGALKVAAHGIIIVAATVGIAIGIAKIMLPGNDAQTSETITSEEMRIRNIERTLIKSFLWPAGTPIPAWYLKETERTIIMREDSNESER